MRFFGFRFRLVLLAAGMIAVCATVRAQYVPSWWVDPTGPVLNPNTTSSNFSPVTVGQLKWIATQAERHLDNTLSEGAGSPVHDVVDSFKPVNGVTYTQAELDLIHRDNMAVANIGQVKAVAELFYARLNTIGYDTKLNLIANGYPPQWNDSRPWNSGTPVSENYKPINLGQLKLVFSFDIVDTNGNGTWDYLEGIYPASSPTRDTDGDGVPDIEDAFPNDPTKSVQLVNDPNDHTPPTIISITQPPGATLLP